MGLGTASFLPLRSTRARRTCLLAPTMSGITATALACRPMPLGPGLQPSPPARLVELPGRGTTYVHEVHGPTGAPTVVLLHGWTVTAALNWFGCFEPLGRHFNVVALDH